MPDSPVVMILGLIVLVAIGVYVIYLILRPKPKVSPRQASDKKKADDSAAVDEVLRKAHINPSDDFHVGRQSGASE